MDFADDVAYSVHDVEDGVVAGRIDLTGLRDTELRWQVWETARDWYAPRSALPELEAAFERLAAVNGWPQTPYDASRRHLAGLKNLTSALINRFCSAVRPAPTAEWSGAPVRYAACLDVPPEIDAEIAVLKGIAAHLVMKADDRVTLLSWQRELLAELVDALEKGPVEAFDAAFRADLEAAGDDAARLRVVVDQVASLTDVSAVDRHRTLVGTA